MDKNIILIVILFPFVFGISFFILNLITGVMTIIAVGLGALFRKYFGIRGCWSTGIEIAVAMVTLGKALTALLFTGWMFGYWFLSPDSGVVTAAGVLGVGSALLIWCPAVFFMALFGGLSDRTPDYSAGY